MGVVDSVSLGKCRTRVSHNYGDGIMNEPLAVPPVGKLGELLAKGRKDSGLSLRDSAALSGVNNSYISQLERGGVEFDVSPNKLHALAEVYNICYTDLMLAAGYVAPECPECGVKL